MTTEQQRKKLFIRVTTFLKESRGINYKLQAQAINSRTNTMPISRMKNIRSLEGLYPKETEIQALFNAFDEQLKDEDFTSEPISITRLIKEKESLQDRVDKLTAEAKSLRRKIEDEIRKNKTLTNILDRLTK